MELNEKPRLRSLCSRGFRRLVIGLTKVIEGEALASSAYRPKASLPSAAPSRFFESEACKGQA